MRRIVFVILIALFASIANADTTLTFDQLDDASKAYFTEKKQKNTTNSESVRRLKLLAEQGNIDAQYELGEIFYRGDGVPKDFTEAIRWYRMAAEQGNANSQYTIGYMYEYGWGHPQNYAEARSWYRKAAAQGIASAQHNLGNMYRQGIGVTQDYVKAHKWLNIAAVGGSYGADYARDELAKEMTLDQLTEAQRLAQEWWLKKEQ